MLSWIDSVTIFASLGLVVFAVTRASRKSATGSEYFLAGRDLRWWFIGMSLFASNISAEHVLGLAGDGYRVGMVAGGYEWVSGWDLIMLAMLFAPLYLREKIFTIPEFLERRFGWPLRAFLSANLLVINVFTKNAIDIWAGSLLFTVLFGWNQLLVMIVLSAFTALYTMKGGLRAVVYADMVQGTWLILSSALLTILGLNAVGGWSGLVAHVPHTAIQMVKPLNDDFPITGFLIANFFAGMFYWCMDQTNVQRVLGAQDFGGWPARRDVCRLPEASGSFHPGSSRADRPGSLSGDFSLRPGLSAARPGAFARGFARLGAGRPDCDSDVVHERVLQRQRHAGGQGFCAAIQACHLRKQTGGHRPLGYGADGGAGCRGCSAGGPFGNDLVLPAIHLRLPFRSHGGGYPHRAVVEEGKHQGGHRRGSSPASAWGWSSFSTRCCTGACPCFPIRSCTPSCTGRWWRLSLPWW